uniref:Reverse transcriptase zinc-binding domain-containing protein n=1 Tax=Tanacetum cinerariifolium TaxID=118510 RepID=A0A6L2K7R0_TANCI|nr:hypothetical protein [Tanacetum cinerariifolium]
MLCGQKYNIPRHAIHLWLMMRGRVKTQDRLRQWDVVKDVNLYLLRCPFCKLQLDTHEDLFFKCLYSSRVWSQVLIMADLPNISPVWIDVMGWISPMSKSNNVTSTVGRLVVAVLSYFIWQEHNKRIYEKNGREPEEITNIVVDIIRLKLASINFRKKVRVATMKKTWILPINE